jgi:outer membrane protein assembly factor BamB
MNNATDDGKIRLRYTIARRAAIISTAFFLILSILMIANYIQTESVDPLNSKALNKLMMQLQENPDDEELKEQIRALDLLARRAYFTNRWQTKTGSYLLIAFAAVIFVSLKSISSVKRQFPDLMEKISSESSWENKIISKRYFAYSGITILVIALLAGLFAEDSFTSDSSTGGSSMSEAVSLETIQNNWPQFRGPQGNGIVYNNENLPLSWDGEKGENIIWKTSVPLEGFNSPIIWEGKIFLSGTDNENQAVFCFNTDNGELIWEHKLNDIPGSPDPRPKVMDYTGYAAPTMVTDGTGVYVIFGTGDIAGITFEGERMWAKNLGSPVNHYGHASSLAMHAGTLLVQFDQNTGGHLIGLDSKTGGQVYDRSRDIEISWASPILINTDRGTEVVLSANPYIISYDPATGNEFWRFKCMSGEVGPSPAFADGIVFAVNDYARLAAVKLGDVPELLWETDEDLSEISSPVANEEVVIMAASFGTVSCFDSKTGERYWYYDTDEGFYSSPILANSLIYIMDVSGLMHVIKAEKTLELVSTNPLGEKSTTTPAFYNNRIFIRGEENLYCIGKQD